MIYEKGKSKVWRNARRFLSGFLALLMVVGLIPTTSFVSEAAPVPDPTVTIQADVNGSQQDVTGSISYTSDDHVFTITVPDYVGDAAWSSWGENVLAIARGADGCVESAYAVTTSGATASFRLNTNNVAWLSNGTVTVVGASYKSAFTVNATGQTATTVTYGDLYELPINQATTTPEDKAFIGWQDQDGMIYAPGAKVTVKKNMNFTEYFADVNAEQYVVTFQDGVGNVLSSTAYDKDAVITAPAAPTREGYEFTAWDKGWTEGTTAAANIVYTAQWTAKQHQVTPDADESKLEYSTGTVNKYTDEQVEYTVEAKAGYTIISLSVKDSNDKYIPFTTVTNSDSKWVIQFTMPADDVTITADAEAGGNKVTFMTDDEGVWDTQSVATGGQATAPAEPTKEGCTFKGWSTVKDDATKIVNVADATVTADITYYAIFEQGTYTVTNNSEDLISVDKPTAAYGETVTITPKKIEGYESAVPTVVAANGTPIDVVATASGTYTFTMPAQNVTVSATNAVKTYTVKFKSTYDASLLDVQEVAHGNTATYVEAPAKRGYDFVGWQTSDGRTLTDAITENTTFWAVYTKQSHTVDTVIAGANGDIAEVETDRTGTLPEYDYGDTVTLTVTVPEGYALKHIVAANATGDRTTPITEVKYGETYTFEMPEYDVIVTATFEKVPEDAYVVKFVSDGSLYDITTVTNGDVIKAPETNPSKTGYTFKGWFNGSDQLNSDTTASKDVTYEAKFEAIPYTISKVVDPEDSVVVDTTTGTYGEVKDVTVTPQSGYELSDITVVGESGAAVPCVAISGSKYQFTMPAENVTITVTFKKVEAGTTVVKFVSDGTLYDYQTVAKGTSGTTPEKAPVKAGFTFKGWSIGGGTLVAANSSYDVAADAADEIVYTAQWEENNTEFDITVVPATGVAIVCAETKAIVGTEVTFTAEANTGYDLLYVTVKTTDDKAVSVVRTDDNTYAFTMPEANVKISAKAVEQVPEYTIDFRLADGTMVDQKVVAKGAEIPVPESAPSKEGYTFAGWFDAKEGGNAMQTPAIATKDTTYYAQFTANDLTVTYTDSGNVDNVKYGDSYLVGEPVDTDNFICWASSDGQMMLPGNAYTIKESVELTPVYQQDDPIYLVNFKGLDGKIYYSYLATVDNDYKVTTPAIPDIEGYDVANAKWSDGIGTDRAAGVVVDITDNTDFTLTATPKTYNVKVNDEQNKTQSSATSVAYDSSVTLTVTTPDGYVLKSLTITGNVTGKGISYAQNSAGEYTFTMPAEDVTVDVTWEEIPAGTTLVKFVNDGALYDYQIVTKGTQLTAPEAPTKAGYTFGGWKLDESTTISAGGTYSVSTDAADEIVFNAKWTAKEYKVSYALDGGTPDVPAQTAEYGDVVTLAAAPEKEGYTFIGWLGNQTNMIYNAGAKYTVTADVEFTAQWEVIPPEEYVVKFVDQITGILYGYEVVTDGEAVTAPVAPTRVGYTFGKWVDSVNSNNSVAAGEPTSPITANTVFVAEWTQTEYNVTSAGNNCTVDPVTQKANYNDTVTFTVTPNTNYAVESVSITYTLNGTTEVKVLTPDAAGEYSFTMPGADVQINASAKQTIFNIEKVPDMYLSIDGPNKAEAGTDVEFTVKDSVSPYYSVGNVYVEAEDGTKVPVSVVVNGSTVEYHFTMPESDVTIYAQQVHNQQTVCFMDSDNTLLDIEIVGAGDIITMPDQKAPEGYTFAGWKLLMNSGNTVYAAGEEVEVKADMYLQAVYKGESYKVAAGEKTNVGKLDARLTKDSSNSVNLIDANTNTLAAENGKTVYFAVAAKYNWTITDITITSADGNSDLVVVPVLQGKSTITDTDGNECELLNYAFTMPNEDVNINVYTEAKEYNVKVEENIPEAGDYTINGYTTTNRDVAQGSTVEVAVTAKEGYRIDKVDGTYINALGNVAHVVGTFDNGVYSFEMVPFDVTVEIEYVANEYNVNVTESNGTETTDGTYKPQRAGKGDATEPEDINVDNKGYVVLYDAAGNALYEDNDGNGIYYPANSEYKAGDKVSFSVYTCRGWVFNNVTVTYDDGTQSCQTTFKDGKYYFNMPAADDVKITANFVKDSYTITKEINGEDHGTITMNGLTEKRIESSYKDEVNVTVTPEDGYYVKSISYALEDTTAVDFSNGVDYTSGAQTDVHDGAHSITFNTPSSDVTVTVEYAAIDYSLSTNVTGEGSVVLSADSANVGDQITINANPVYGYKLVQLSVKNNTTGNLINTSLDQTEAENGGVYTFDMPADPVTVYAEFQKVDYTVTYINYDNTVIAIEGVTYKDTADVAGHVADVVTGPTGQHFVGWVSEDVETAVTAPSTDNDDFVVVKDTTVQAVFEYDKTNVEFASTENGTVTTKNMAGTELTAPATIDDTYYQDMVEFKATPDEGYEIDQVSVMTLDKDGEPVSIEFTEALAGKNGTYTFQIPATYKDSVHEVQSENVYVSVTFKKSTYTLTQDSACGTDGTIAVNGIVSTQTSFNYAFNDEVSITATPNAGYYVDSIVATYEDGTKENVSGAVPAMDTPAGDPVTLTFNMPAQDVTYKVTYAKIDYSITREFNAEQGNVETFDKNGNAIDNAQIDDKVDIKVTPKKGYALKTLTVTYDNGTQSVVLTGVDENVFTFKMPAKAVKVTAVFTEVTYTAKLTQKGEGDVTLNTYFTGTMNADYLDTVTINAAPADGWYLASITVTGDAETGEVGVNPAIDPAGGDYTFTMPNCNVTVEVVFEKTDYSITVVNDDTQGTVTTQDKANVGDVVKVKVEPKKGYELDELTVTYADGQKSVALTKTGTNNYTFTMPAADVTVTATYKTVTYTASLDKTGKGTIRLNGHNTTKIDANYKDTVSIQVSPDEGWRVKSITVAGGDVEISPAVNPAGGVFTFTMPNYNVEISVVMEKIKNEVTTYAVNAYEDGHGTIIMNSTVGQVGDKMTITADPDDGYRVKRVVVTDASGNSVPVSFVSEGIDYLENWSFTMPASAVNVKVVFEAYAASYYTDCRTDDWYYEAVTYLTDKGLMTGMTDNLFGPNILMTREMFVTVLARMEGVDISAYAGQTGGFTDASADGWYAPYVAWAASTGVTTGYTDGSGRFGVGDPITREQMFTMMYRYAQYKGVDTSVTYPQFMDRYVDKNQISPYAYDALVWCVSEGVAKGMTDTTINPQEYAPRAHAAQMFKNYIDNVWYR